MLCRYSCGSFGWRTPLQCGEKLFGCDLPQEPTIWLPACRQSASACRPPTVIVTLYDWAYNYSWSQCDWSFASHSLCLSWLNYVFRFWILRRTAELYRPVTVVLSYPNNRSLQLYFYLAHLWAPSRSCVYRCRKARDSQHFFARVPAACQEDCGGTSNVRFTSKPTSARLLGKQCLLPVIVSGSCRCRWHLHWCEPDIYSPWTCPSIEGIWGEFPHFQRGFAKDRRWSRGFGGIGEGQDIYFWWWAITGGRQGWERRRSMDQGCGGGWEEVRGRALECNSEPEWRFSVESFPDRGGDAPDGSNKLLFRVGSLTESTQACDNRLIWTYHIYSTTGVPKGVEITHRNFVANVAQVIQTMRLSSEFQAHDNRQLGMLPMYHAVRDLAMCTLCTLPCWMF